MAKIHPTAIVHPKAELASDVEVGPYTIIGEHVKAGPGTVIGSHCVLDGHTTIGARNRIFTGAVVGSIPQDLKYKGGKSYLEIGDDNILREYMTLNPGTDEGTKTVVGNKNELMAYVHVAHDCVIGNGIIIANAGTLAGYVVIEDKVVVGGLSAVHQFVRIGTLSIIGGCSKIVQDVTPYSMVDGHPAKLYSINAVGLRRAGIPEPARRELKRAIRILTDQTRSIPHAVEKIEAQANPRSKELAHLVAFIQSSKRSITR